MTTTQVRYWYLEQRDGASQKFYEVWTFDHIAITAWGRIGTHGQHKVHDVFSNSDDATARAIAQVYAKRSKKYEILYDDFVFEVDNRIIDRVTTRDDIFSLRDATREAFQTQDATPRDVALNYIDGFIGDCNQFLARAKDGWEDGGYADFEMERAHAELNERWAELKDKFDSAETMMQMVNMRALKRV